MHIEKDIEVLQTLLDSKYHQLQLINELTCAINSQYSNQEIFELYAQCLKSGLGINTLYIIAQNDGWECILKKEVQGEIDVSLLVRRFQNINKPEVLKIPNSFLTQFEAVIPVLKNNAPIAYALIGNIQHLNYESRIELYEFVATLTNVATIVIENNRLFVKQVDRDMLIKDLSVAAEIQSMLVPQSLPNNSNIEMAAYYHPMQLIGGDYYDCIELDSNQFIFCIADVSGKGVGAAMLMANFQSTLRILLQTFSSLEKLIPLLNQYLFQNTKGDKYLTFFIGHYNTNSHQLRYCNCGHISPYIANISDCSALQLGTTILGAFDELPHLNIGQLEIQSNTMLIAYTDGLQEIQNNIGMVFTESHIISLLKASLGGPARMLNARIVSQIKSVRSNKENADDICVLSILFK